MSTHLILIGQVEAIEIAPKTEASALHAPQLSADLIVYSRENSLELRVREDLRAPARPAARARGRTHSANERRGIGSGGSARRAGRRADLLVEQRRHGEKPRPAAPRIDEAAMSFARDSVTERSASAVGQAEAIKLPLKLVLAR